MVLPPLFERGVFVLFLVAIVIVALYAGLGPGLLAILLSISAIDYFFIPPLYELSVLPLTKLTGLIVFTVCALLVTAFSEAHRRSGAVLRERKEELKHAQALTHVGSYVLHNPHSKHDHWSDETFRIVGLDPAGGTLSPEEYIRRVVHSADQVYVTEVVGNAVKYAQAFDFEYRVVRPDGSVRFVHSIGKPVTDRDGNVVKLIGTLQDITERKLVQTALEEREAQLGNAPCAIVSSLIAWLSAPFYRLCSHRDMAVTQ